MDTPRRAEELPEGKVTTISEDGEYFDTSSGKSNWRLSMYQSAKSGKVSTGKEKDRKPLDPPPFVQLTASYRIDPTRSFISSPYYFMKCELVESELDPDDPPKAIHGGLSGTQVSSLYKLKDTYNHTGAFFSFGDVAVTRQGKFRLKFTLYERPFNPADQSYLAEYVERSFLFSPVFTAFPARSYPGLEQSTPKTQGFAEQGVRLRIRKESLASGSRKRNLSAVTAESPTEAQASRAGALRRRMAYSSVSGPATLPLASPTQLVPTQGFPTPPQQHQQHFYYQRQPLHQQHEQQLQHQPQQQHQQQQQQQQQQQHYHHQQSHSTGHAMDGGSHDTGGAAYPWTPELQSLAAFPVYGSPIATAPPPWPGHHQHQHQHHQGHHNPHGPSGH